jgi:hypothetical protein
MKREHRFRYLGPTEQLVERLARLERRRLNLLAEERAVATFLAEHPELKPRLPKNALGAASPGLRLVVNNTRSLGEDGDGPRAA